MLPSLYSGISGLKVNQQKLNIVANNIANSSTTGFKTQSMNFEDMMSQTLSDASAPVENGLGGVNAKQSGLGVKIAGINTDFSEGSQQTTNRNLDFMLDKAGSYFVVSPDGDTNGEYYYTRDGSFVLDSKGNLLTQDGYHVMGYDSGAISGPITFPITDKITSYSIGQDGTITVKTESDPTGTTVGQIALASFPNEGGLVKKGGNLYASSENSGDATYGTGGTDAYGNVIQGALEMSNVDLAQQFTDMIVAQRAFQANGKIISTDDEVLQTLVGLKR
jgi:flagellar hook protein FlgE